MIRSVLRSLVRNGRGAPRQSPAVIPAADDPEQQIPGLYDRGIRLRHCRWRWGHPANDQALIFLCHLAARAPGPVVEFGTFDGRTTVNLALNLAAGQVITIDAGLQDAQSNADSREYGAFQPGACFLTAERSIRERIVFIRSDSRDVDMSEYFGRASLVLVDGGHGRDVVENDTRLALRLARGGGVVVWDDYTPYWPGVKGALDELASRVPLVHYPRLGFVIHVKP